MKWYDKKNVLNIGIGVLGVITAIASFIAGVKLIGLGLDWVLEVERYSPRRELAEALSVLIVAKPIALWSYFTLKK